MKNIFLISLLILGLWSCEDDESSFENTLALQDLSFTPVAGGAVMHYKLPDDDEIISLVIRYKDFKGDDVRIEGSYASDSLVIIGFNEAQKGVPARVSLCNRYDKESASIDVTFDTDDSGCISFFKTLEVAPYWSGFELKYTGIRRANGYANIFYEGTDPLTGEPDWIFVDRIIIQQGEQSHKFSLKQPQDVYKVLIRTEDFRGYFVKEEVFEVGADAMKQLQYNTDFSFEFSCSKEDPDQKLGIAYLFDGDKKGYANLKQDSDDPEYYTFLAGPNAVGKPMKVKFNTPQIPSSVRLYTKINVRFFGKGIFNFCYYNRLPCSVSIYGTDTPENEKSWELLQEKEQAPESPYSNRWCSRAPGLYRGGNAQTAEELDGISEQYWDIQFPVLQKSYSYLIIVVNDVFEVISDSTPANDQEYVTLNELEIYVKK